MGKLTAGDIEAALGGSCFGCAIAKGRITKPKSLPHDHPSRATKFGQRLSIDLIIGISTWNVLVSEDEASRFLRIKCQYGKRGSTTLESYRVSWEARHGNPQLCRSDNGPEFADLHRYLNSVGCRKELTAPYSPESNGINEKSHDTIGSMLKAILFHSQLPRTPVIVRIMLENHIENAYNHTVHSFTGKAPVTVALGLPSTLESIAFYAPGRRCMIRPPQHREGHIGESWLPARIISKVHSGEIAVINEMGRILRLQPGRIKFNHVVSPQAMVQRDEDLGPPTQAPVPSPPTMKVGDDDWWVTPPASDTLSPDPPMDLPVEDDLDHNDMPPLMNPDDDVGDIEPPRHIDDDDPPPPPRPTPDITTSIVGDVKGRTRIALQPFQSSFTVEQSIFDRFQAGLLFAPDGPRYDEVSFATVHDGDFTPDELKMAREAEINGWKESHVFDLADGKQARLEQRQGKAAIISVRWVNTRKDDGTAKSRLVALGYQDPRQDIDSNSPTASADGFRAFLTTSLALGLDVVLGDVRQAYLNADLLSTMPIYIRPPPEYRQGDLLWRLLKAVYGLADAGTAWFECIKAALISCGWIPLRDEPCIFVKDGAFILLYVDDILVRGSLPRR